MVLVVSSSAFLAPCSLLLLFLLDVHSLINFELYVGVTAVNVNRLA